MLIKLARNLTGGKSPQPIDNAREYSLPRLDEQGASKRRIGLYLARWLGWAACACVPLSHAAVCTNPPTVGLTPYTPASYGCNCFHPGQSDGVYLLRHLSTGTVGEQSSTRQCISAADTECASPSSNNSEGTHYYKNNTETNSYFSCDWTPSVGYSNPQNYTSTTPPTPAPFAPTALLFALFASLGSFFAYRVNRNKSQKGN